MFVSRESVLRAPLLLLPVVFILLSATGDALAEEVPGASASPQAQSAGGAEHLEALRSLDPAERIEAIRALGEARSVEAVGPLARVLREDPSPEVRGWAVRSLSEIGTTEARAALAIAAQHDSDQRVRTLAVQMSGPTTASPFAQSPPVAGHSAPLVQQPQPATYSPMMEGPMRGPFPARRRRPGLGLTIAGWSVFGGTYLISMIVGAATLADGAENTWSLFLPVIGPIVEAGFLFANYDEDLVAPIAVLLFIDALAQIAGVALGTLGLVRRHRAQEAAADAEAGPEEDVEGAEESEEAGEPEEPIQRSSRRQWGLAIVPSTGGLTLSGWF